MLQLIWPYFGHELCSFLSPFFGGSISKWIWAEMGKTSKWAAAYDIFQKRSRNRTNGLEGKPTLALIIYWILPKKIQKKPKKWSFDNLDNCWRVLRKTFEINLVSIEVTSTMPFLLYCSITLETRCENSHLSEEKYGSNSVSKSHVIWQTVSGLLENLSPCYDATIFGSKSEVCHS